MTEEDTFKRLRRKPVLELEALWDNGEYMNWSMDGNTWVKYLEQHDWTYQEWWDTKTYNEKYRG